ncbi:MAG: hypothetical protein M3Y07_01075 [Acidobacteriota bacterium]|nr:hypothetical protein [Acidobacteriota bacterium]
MSKINIYLAAFALAVTAACNTSKPGDPYRESGKIAPAPNAIPGEGAAPGAKHVGPTTSDSRLSPRDDTKNMEGRKDKGVDVPPGEGTLGSGNRPPGTGNHP